MPITQTTIKSKSIIADKNSKTSVIERSSASLSSRHRNRKKRPCQSRDRADENIRAGEERRRSNGGRGDKNKESDRP